MNLSSARNLDTLQDAFQVFNELSQNLTRSYLDLESRVEGLSRELAAARSERMDTLIEKEKLATRLQHLLEALPGGVLVTDGSGWIIEHNAAATGMIGAPLKGRHWLDALNAAAVPAIDTPQQRQLRDGRTLSLSLSPLGDAEPGQVILLTDISELRALQDMLNQQRRLSALGEMVASLAHQVRTPLSAALLYSGHLGNGQLTDAQRTRFAAKLTERLQHMERQVSSMLSFARIGRLSQERIDAPALLARAVDAFEPLLKDRPIRLEVCVQPAQGELFGNEDALLGVLLNLLNNAAEACGEAPGFIRLALEQGMPGWLRIVVVDSGPGVPEALQARIFEPFFTTRAQGTGLGLAIVDCVVRAHGGTVACRSASATGASFSIDLPIAATGALLPGGFSGTEPSSGVHSHVLV